ncbi:hypothetical protein L596_004451 [Steinernema carpocapsae]|uniref:Uncharacterized protein n=1 Tax=Steinernema carpocapsae TaxID=34508 RepID=A0A4U8UW07_STECR|nr:hypothetical protein L596_004451 [Steinernema carpocapsae]
MPLKFGFNSHVLTSELRAVHHGSGRENQGVQVRRLLGCHLQRGRRAFGLCDFAYGLQLCASRETYHAPGDQLLQGLG